MSSTIRLCKRGQTASVLTTRCRLRRSVVNLHSSSKAMSNRICANVATSPRSCVRSVWLHRDLESLKKRLAALERPVAETGDVLTKAKVVALGRL